jgi:hypothetical protein
VGSSFFDAPRRPGCEVASVRGMIVSAVEELGEFVGTFLLNWYLNEVEGRGPRPRRRGGAVVALHRRGQVLRPLQW